MPDSGIFKEIQKSERHNSEMITKCSSGVWPVWIGSMPETPALNLFTNLFLSPFKLLLKASPLGSLPRSAKLLAASVGWPCLNLVLPGVLLTHLPPRSATPSHQAKLLPPLPASMREHFPFSPVCQSALIPSVCLTFI